MIQMIHVMVAKSAFGATSSRSMKLLVVLLTVAAVTCLEHPGAAPLLNKKTKKANHVGSNQTSSAEERKLIGSLLFRDKIIRTQCNWKPSPFRKPLQEFINVLRTIQRYSIDGGGTGIGDCYALITGDDTDYSTEAVDSTFKELDGSSGLGAVLGKAYFETCTESRECFNNRKVGFCGKDPAGGDSTCQPCSRCLDEEFPLDDPQDPEKPQRRPLDGEQCFNVCPGGVSDTRYSCGITASRYFVQIVNWLINRKMCGARSADKLSILTTGGNKYKYIGASKFSDQVFGQTTGLSLKEWTRVVALFFKFVKTTAILPTRKFFELLGKKSTYAELFADRLKNLEDVFERPLQWSKSVDRRAEDYCFVPCEDEASQNPALSQVPWIAFQSKKVLASNAEPPLSCNPNLNTRAQDLDLSTYLNGPQDSNSLKNRAKGFLMKVGQKSQQFNRLLNDYILYSELYYLVLSDPVEDFLCLLNNLAADLAGTMNEADENEKKTRRLLEEKSAQSTFLRAAQSTCPSLPVTITELFDEDEVASALNDAFAPAKNAISSLSGIQDKITATLEPTAPLEQGPDDIDDVENYRIFDALFLPLVTANNFISGLNSIFEEIFKVIIAPLDSIVEFFALISGLLDKVNGVVSDVPDLGIMDFVLDNIVNPLISLLPVQCDSLNSCFSVVVVEAISLVQPCECLNDDDCEAKGIDKEKSCFRFIVPDVPGVDFDVDPLPDMDLNLENPFDLPEFDYIFGNFSVDMVLDLRGLDGFLPDLSTNLFSGVLDKFNGLLDCFSDKVQFRYKRVNTNLVDGATMDLKDSCPSDTRVITRQATFKRGSKCQQDLSSRLRYPETLVGSNEQGNEDGQVKFSFTKCESNCVLTDVGQYLDQECRDEELLEDVIDLNFGNPSPDDLTPLGWIPANSIFREVFSKGYFEVIYLCWGFEGDPPFVGELISDPESARPEKNPKGRSTDVDSNRKFILRDDATQFDPTIYKAEFLQDDEEVGGAETGPFNEPDYPRLRPDGNSDWSQTAPDGASRKLLMTEKLPIINEDQTCEFGVSLGTGGCPDDDCLGIEKNKAVLEDQQSWPGNAYIFPGSKLQNKLDSRMFPSLNDFELCIDKKLQTGCDLFPGSPDNNRCNTMQKGVNDQYSTRDFLWATRRHYPDDTFDSKVQVFENELTSDGTRVERFHNVLNTVPGNEEVWNFGRLGSRQKVLKKYEYKEPTGTGNLECLAGRQLHIETLEFEPCINLDEYASEDDIFFDEGYCSFRNQFGGETIDGICLGTSGCDASCLNPDEEQSFDCNCHDNNCVKYDNSGSSYLHRGFPNNFEDFGSYLRSLDLKTAYENWGACSFWIYSFAPTNPLRAHTDSQVECKEESCSSSKRTVFDTYDDCVREARGSSTTGCSPSDIGSNYYGFAVAYDTARFGMCRGDERCERVFDPTLETCPSEFGRTESNYKPYTDAAARYEARRQSLFDSCDAEIRDTCTGKETCNYLRCSGLTSSKKEIGILQWACVRPPGTFDGFNELKMMWTDSLKTTPDSISCLFADGYSGITGQVIYGQPFSQRDVSDLFFDTFCSDDDMGITCDVNARAMAAQLGDNDSKGKVLRVDYSCVCGEGYQALPNEKGECISCPPNFFRASGDKACRQCQPGTYQSAPNQCTPCPAGSYSSEYGSIICTPCPIGTFSTDDGLTKEEDCLCPPDHFMALHGANVVGFDVEGEVRLNNQVIPCPAGTERVQEERTFSETGPGDVLLAGFVTSCKPTCSACGNGLVREASSPDGCVPCPSGHLATADKDGCEPCPLGTYTSPGAQVCLRCPYGCYSDTEAATQCKKCELLRPGYTTPWPVSDDQLDAPNVWGCTEPIETETSNPSIPPGATCQDLVNLAASSNPRLLLVYGTDESQGRTEPVTVQEYINERRGDGYCDGWPLNTEECGWDGGDCCEATCIKVTANLTFANYVLEEMYNPSSDDDLRTNLRSVSRPVLNAVAVGLQDRLQALDTDSELSASVFVTDLAASIVESLDPEVADGSKEKQFGYFFFNDQATSVFPFNLPNAEELFIAGDINESEAIDEVELTSLLSDLISLLTQYNEFIKLDSSCTFQQFQCLQPESERPPCSPPEDEVINEDPNPDACVSILNDEQPGPDTLDGWGNGVCDQNLNHASCAYDGGDCCVKTCVYNRCRHGSCSKASTSACRDPDANQPSKRPPPQLRTVQGTTDIPDVTASCDAVPRPVNVFITDASECADSSLEYNQERTDSTNSCPTQYALLRTWDAFVKDDNGEILASADPLSHTVSVQDNDAPIDMYAQEEANEEVLCLWPTNRKWVSIEGASKAASNAQTNKEGATFNVGPNPLPASNVDGDPFGLQALLIENFTASTLRWEFFECAPVYSVSLVGCVSSDDGPNSSPGCRYDPTSDTLYVQGRRKNGRNDNIYTISATVNDGTCGNEITVTRKIVVPRNAAGLEERDSGICSRQREGSTRRSPNLKDVPSTAQMF